MPLYEYRCRVCRRRFTKFFRSIASATDPGPCPACGSASVERLISRVTFRRGSSDPMSEWDGEPGYAGNESEFDLEADETSADEEFPDLPDTEDPRELARWTREMAATVGEPLDPALDRALRDLERGEDPDRVLERLEEETANIGDEASSGEAESERD